MAKPKVAAPQARWLTPDEMQTWQTLHLLLAKLPTALGSQLQADSDLSFVEYYVLAVLSGSPDRTMRMSRLAVLANSELSRLSHLMSRLERRGFVRRAADPTDGRFTNGILTDCGYEHLVAAAPGHVNAVRELVFDPLSEADHRALRRAAAKVLAQIGKDDC